MFTKLHFGIQAAVIAVILGLACPASGMYAGSEPTHGWYNKPIRLDYSSGGPNVRVLEETGITITRISSREYNAFGYFTYNPYNNQIIESAEVSFDNGDSVFVGEFAPNTRIGTWLTTDNGTFYSMPSLNDYNEYRAAYLGDTSEGNMMIGLEGGHTWGGSDYREMIVAIEPGTHAPAGQPLPGVLISALIGLGITGAAGLKKQRK